MKNKKIKNKYKSKYQVGGMYSNNTVGAAGQGSGIQNTSNIVYQENDPRLQEQRIKASETQRLQLQQESLKARENIEQFQVSKQQELQQSAALRESKESTIDQVVGQGAKYGAKAAKGISSYFTKRAAKKGAQEVSQMLAKSVLPEAGAKALNLGIDAGSKYAYKTGTELAQQKLVEAGAKKMGEETLKVAATEGTKATVGTAVKSSFNPSPYATAANLIGNIGGVFVDDQDATTWTAGEASMDILGDAGEYAGYGATIGSALGPAGTAIGAGVGAVVGTGKAVITNLTQRKKARGEAEKGRKKLALKKQKYNAKLGQNLALAQKSVRAGELKQKTYSGYDLGRNVVAQMGGMRMGMPRYGYAA